MDFAAIDFETANHSMASVCAVGLVIVEGGKVREKVLKLVRPKELHFDPFNVMIHGITEDIVKNEPEFCDLWPEIRSLVEGKVVLAHNSSFDMGVLREVLHQYGLDFPPLRSCCTVKISRKVWPELNNHKLSTVAEHLGISFRHHNALEDALACAKIAVTACRLYDVATIDELAERIRISVRPVDNSLPRRTYSNRSPLSFPNPKDIVPDTANLNSNHPFFGATCVFTGNLKSMSRKEAMQTVVNCGGYCSNNVSKRTQYLVMGETDFSRVKGGKSAKLRKAEQLINNGSELIILKEEDFLKLVKFLPDEAI